MPSCHLLTALHRHIIRLGQRLDVALPRRHQCPDVRHQRECQIPEQFWVKPVSKGHCAPGLPLMTLLQREPNLERDLIAMNLAVFDVTAHLRDLEPTKIS